MQCEKYSISAFCFEGNYKPVLFEVMLPQPRQMICVLSHFCISERWILPRQGKEGCSGCDQRWNIRGKQAQAGIL